MSMNPPTAAPEKKGPNWMLLGTGAALVLGVLTLVMKNSGGGGTTAAGTSINAALGSLQEEQLNTQGQIGQLNQSIGLGTNETLVGHIDANQAATLGAISDVGTQVAGVGSQVTNLSGQLSSATTAINTNITNTGAGITSAVQTAQAQEGSDAAASSAQAQGFFAQLMDALAGLFGGQQQAQASLNSLSSGQQQVLINQALGDIHNQINFDAVQAGLNGNMNPQVAAHLQAATNGTY